MEYIDCETGINSGKQAQTKSGHRQIMRNFTVADSLQTLSQIILLVALCAFGYFALKLAFQFADTLAQVVEIEQARNNWLLVPGKNSSEQAAHIANKTYK